MTPRQILSLRIAGWVVTAIVILFNTDLTAKESVNRPAPDQSANGLVEAYDCGSHVQDPTHAVVTVNQHTRYVGQRLTDRAIEQAVFGIDHGLIVHGFCS